MQLGKQNPMASHGSINEALKNAIAKIEKDHGKGSIMKLGANAALDIDVIPSGSLAIDIALGIGGFPRGRVVEIYGVTSGGKTTLTLHLIAQAQKLGGVCAFIDAEHALDPAYARALGVDTANLLVSQPDNGEQALEIAETLIESNSVAVVIIDSVAALVPKAELEGDMGQAQMGLQARLMSQALRKLTAKTAKSNTCLVFINQVREKLGILFGSPETTTGGNALKFYASIRLDVRRVSTNTADGVKVSNEVKVKVAKNKLAAPFKEATVELIFGQGISNTTDLIRLGVEKELIERSGAWFSYKGEKIGQGEDKARQFLIDNPKISEKLEADLRAIYFPKGDNNGKK